MFIGLSWLIADLVYAGRIDRGRFLAISAALLCAFVIFIGHRHWLGFEYAGRAEFMATMFGEKLYRNFRAAPVAFLPFALWAWIVAPRDARYRTLFIAWLLILAGVSMLTTDVTRVFTLISLPIVVVGTEKAIRQSATDDFNGRFAAMAILVLMVPPVSWSGLDWFLWGDLLNDFCKWHVLCL